MPNGEEPEPTNPTEEDQNQPGGFGQPARQIGQEKVKQVAKQAVKQAAKQAIKAAGRAAVLALAPLWPYILGAILIIGAGVIIFLAATGALQGGFGGTPLQAATLNNNSHVLEFKELINNLRLDLSVSQEIYNTRVKLIQDKISFLEKELANASPEIKNILKQLKDKSDLLATYQVSSQKEIIKTTLDSMANLAEELGRKLGGLIYTSAERTQVLAVIEQAEEDKIITYNDSINRNDILKGKTKDSLLHFLAEAANHARQNNYTIKITTTATDHSEKTVSGKTSYHVLGLALDIGNEDIAPKIMPWIFDNRETLRIYELIGPSGPNNSYRQWQVKNMKPFQYAQKIQVGHENHIHVATKP